MKRLKLNLFDGLMLVSVIAVVVVTIGIGLGKAGVVDGVPNLWYRVLQLTVHAYLVYIFFFAAVMYQQIGGLPMLAAMYAILILVISGLGEGIGPVKIYPVPLYALAGAMLTTSLSVRLIRKLRSKETGS